MGSCECQSVWGGRTFIVGWNSVNYSCLALTPCVRSFNYQTEHIYAYLSNCKGSNQMWPWVKRTMEETCFLKPRKKTNWGRIWKPLYELWAFVTLHTEYMYVFLAISLFVIDIWWQEILALLAPLCSLRLCPDWCMPDTWRMYIL